jgi:FtsZ-interacting cell division protein YlmF
MSELTKEFKKTFTSLFSVKDDASTNTILAKEEERKMNKEKEASHDKLIDRAQQSLRKQETPQAKNGNSVNHSTRTLKHITVNQTASVELIEPKLKEDAQLIIEELVNKRAVIIRLGQLEQSVKRSVVDQIVGACMYASLDIVEIDTQIIMIDPTQNSKR